MALLPILLNDILEDYRRPATLGDIYDQHFGLGLEDFGVPTRSVVSMPGLKAGYLRPWRNLAAGESGVSTIKSDDKEFNVKLDVTHFTPEELTVKLDDEGYAVVEGKHEEKSDQHGFISRHFTRRYKLPEDVLQDTLQSHLSSDGVLSLRAQKKPKEAQMGREIKIIRTNQPAVQDKGEKKTPAQK